MKPIARVLIAGVVLGLALAKSAQAASPGDVAPAFSLSGPQGPVSMADLKGKLVYLDFWASWCVPCRKSFPWMAEMQRKYSKEGFTVLAVNVDAKTDDANRFLSETPAGFPIAFDAKGETPKAYKIKGMPSSVLIGPDGKVLATHMGFKDEDRAALEAQITGALKQVKP